MDVDALRALILQLEWGADEAIEDAPVGRLAAAGPTLPSPTLPSAALSPDASKRAAAATRKAVPPTAPGSRAAAAERAAEAAGRAATLDELRAAMAGFDGCALRDTATGPVLFEGDPVSGLLLVCGPPGAEDDRAGRLLSGPDGIFLDAMLASIGLARASLLATPVIPWRPPGGRPPSPGELAICVPFLHRLIALARTRLAILLGPLPARALLGVERRGRGQVIRAEIPALVSPLPCFVTASPDQLLKSFDRRPAAWADLRRLRRILDEDTHK